LISIHKDGVDPATLHAKLLEENVVTLVRSDRSGRHYLRISPHFYNTDAELHRLLELL
jgi:selenocysteine lyase/cysteine desulfurase